MEMRAEGPAGCVRFRFSFLISVSSRFFQRAKYAAVTPTAAMKGEAVPHLLFSFLITDLMHRNTIPHTGCT